MLFPIKSRSHLISGKVIWEKHPKNFQQVTQYLKRNSWQVHPEKIARGWRPPHLFLTPCCHPHRSPLLPTAGALAGPRPDKWLPSREGDRPEVPGAWDPCEHLAERRAGDGRGRWESQSPGFQTSNWNWVDQYLSQYVFYIYIYVCVCYSYPCVHTSAVSYRHTMNKCHHFFISVHRSIMQMFWKSPTKPSWKPIGLKDPQHDKTNQHVPSMLDSPKSLFVSLHRHLDHLGQFSEAEGDQVAQPYQPASSLVPFFESKITRNNPQCHPLPLPPCFAGTGAGTGTGAGARRGVAGRLGGPFFQALEAWWDQRHLGLIGQNRMKIGWKVDEDQWIDGEKLWKIGEHIECWPNLQGSTAIFYNIL